MRDFEGDPNGPDVAKCWQIINTTLLLGSKPPKYAQTGCNKCSGRKTRLSHGELVGESGIRQRGGGGGSREAPSRTSDPLRAPDPIARWLRPRLRLAPSPPGFPPTHHSARKPLGGPLDFAVGAFAQGLLQLVAVLQVVLVVMPLHPVRLPGLRGRRRGGCGRPRPRLRGRARRPQPQVRAVPGRGRSGPLHVRTRGEPGRRGQGRTGHSARGVGVPAEGNRGALKVAPAALRKQPAPARAAAGSLAAAGTAHLAPPARTIRAPPTGRGELRRVGRGGGGGGRGGGGVRRREGRGVAPSAGGGVLCGAPRPPTPPRQDPQTGRGRGRCAGRPRGRGRGAARPGLPPLAAASGAGAAPSCGGMGACRDSPFVQRRTGRASGEGALSSLGQDGDGGGSQPRRPLPELASRSYREPSAAAAAAAANASSDACSGRSASLPAPAWAAAAAGARRGPGPGRPECSEPGAAGTRSRSGVGRRGLGRPFILFWVSRRPPGRRRGRGWGRGSSAGVGLQAVSHGSPSPAAALSPSRPAGAGTPASQAPTQAGARVARPGQLRALENPQGAR